MRKIKLNKRDVLALIVIACLVVFIIAKYVIYQNVENYRFAAQMENVAAKNEYAVFSIDKIILYSSANAVDNSEGKTMQNMDICQFTDIAIYIDNTSYIHELTDENTVKEMYIDNIKINAATSKGEKSLTYKNPETFAKFKVDGQDNNENTNDNNTENQNNENQQNNNQNDNNENQTDNTNTQANNNEEEDNTVYGEQNNQDQNQDGQNQEDGRINFNVLYTNEDNERSDYTEPTFYTDCSNPITLGYLNKNIVTGYSVSSEDTQVKFDGSLLQTVGVNLDDIACTVDFDIHIKNNQNQDFVCSVGIDIPLKNDKKSIYDGYMYKMQNELQNRYTFFKK